ncbi:response regulator [Pseudomonas sp. A2]|nr:response regulator [Pseudomonas sp. A2]
MPGQIDGLELANVIWSHYPLLPVIIISGHTTLSSEALPDNARFISKPCTIDSLSRNMAELLGFKT